MPVMAVKAPSGKHIWSAVRDELMLNLYPLPFSTLAPTVYHIYMHPDDFAAVEPVASRIVAQIEKALTSEVAALNDGMARQARRVLARLLKREERPPIEVPTSGWEIHIQADRNGEIARGQLGIVGDRHVLGEQRRAAAERGSGGRGRGRHRLCTPGNALGHGLPDWRDALARFRDERGAPRTKDKSSRAVT